MATESAWQVVKRDIARGVKIAFVVALVAALVIVGLSVKSCRDTAHDEKFDAAMAEEAKKREALEAEKATLTEQITELQTSLASQKTEAATEEKTLTVRRQTTRTRVVTDRTKEEARHEAAIKELESDTSDRCTRWLRECEAAKRLGTKPASDPCTCSR